MWPFFTDFRLLSWLLAVSKDILILVSCIQKIEMKDFRQVRIVKQKKSVRFTSTLNHVFLYYNVLWQRCAHESLMD